MRIIGNAEKAREVQAVASGVLPSGQPVIVNADGTVSVVTATSISESLGSSTQFESSDAYHIASAFDSAAGKVVVAYRDAGNSNRGKGIVGTVNGSSISFGSEATFNTSETNWCHVVYDENAEKCVIVYRNSGNSSYLTCVVATVSGTSISFGSAVVIASVGGSGQSACYDSVSQKIIATTGNNAYVGTVSGTSISFGSANSFNSGANISVASSYDSVAQKLVISYRDIDNSNSGRAKVGTVSGNSISFGSAVVFDSSAVNYVDSTYDSSAQKIVIGFSDQAGGTAPGLGKLIVGNVSGTSISFGSSINMNGNTSYMNEVIYDPTSNKIVAVTSSTSGTGDYVVATVSGTSITADSSSSVDSYAIGYMGLAIDSTNNKVVFSYSSYSGGDGGVSKVFQPAYTSTNLTSENYIGMSGGVVVPTVTGSKVSFESSTMGSEYIGATYDPDTGKIILAYQDQGNSYYGTAVVGTVSGTSISFGTPVVFQTSKTKDFCAVYDTANDKVVITYCNEASSDAGTGIVGTVSGTSISFGSPAVFDSSGAGTPHSSVYDTNAGKVVVFYRDTSDSSKGKAAVGTVSGTSISWGSLVNFNGNDYTNAISAVYDSTAQKIVVCFADVGNSTYGSSVVGTVSGTSISFGTKVVFSSSTTQDAFVTYDSSNNKSVVTYKDGGDSDKGKVAVATVSGTSISFGTPVTFVSQVGSNYNCAYDTQLGSVIISYGVASGQGNFITGKVSGTSIGSFSSPYSYYSDTNRVIRPQLVIDGGTGNAVFSFKDQDDSNKGSSTVTSIGYSGQVADGGNTEINIKGAVADNQSGLTAGQSYYVQTDGTLSTTAGDPSVFAGTAVAATKLIVKG